jgi:hypothetical protein
MNLSTNLMKVESKLSSQRILIDSYFDLLDDGKPEVEIIHPVTKAKIFFVLSDSYLDRLEKNYKDNKAVFEKDVTQYNLSKSSLIGRDSSVSVKSNDHLESLDSTCKPAEQKERMVLGVSGFRSSIVATNKGTRGVFSKDKNKGGRAQRKISNNVSGICASAFEHSSKTEKERINYGDDFKAVSHETASRRTLEIERSKKHRAWHKGRLAMELS